MGLDVTLYRFDDYAATIAVEESFNEQATAIYAQEGISDEQRRTEYKAAAKKLGLDEHGVDSARKSSVEFPSVIHPDHHFKVGYFRSSYNEGGINYILEGLGVPNLYDICGVTGYDYYQQPCWTDMLARAEHAYATLKALVVAGDLHTVTCTRAASYGESVVKTPADALSIFRAEQKKFTPSEHHHFDSYSNGDGDFYMTDPLSVSAAVPGLSILGLPCVYLVIKQQPEYFRFYLEAIQIVMETAEYVLAQDDSSKYYLAWSA